MSECMFKLHCKYLTRTQMFLKEIHFCETNECCQYSETCVESGIFLEKGSDVTC